MSMHITAHGRRRRETLELDYWEGEPPAIGDLVLIGGSWFRVTDRAWTSWLDVHLLVEYARPAWTSMIGKADG